MGKQLIKLVVITLPICKFDDGYEINKRVKCEQKDENIDILQKAFHVEIPNWIHTFPYFVDFGNIIKTNIKIVKPILLIAKEYQASKNQQDCR